MYNHDQNNENKFLRNTFDSDEVKAPISNGVIRKSSLPRPNSRQSARNKAAISKSNRKRKLIKKYVIMTMLSIVLFFSVMLISAVAFIVIYGKKNVQPPLPNDITLVQAINSNDPGEQKGFFENIVDTLIQAPRKTNILIMGTDQGGGLSDVIIVGSFDSVTKKIDIISIPRDTHVSITKEQVKEIKNNGNSHVPSSGNMKITELHSYAGSLGNAMVQSEVESLLGIKINYYAEIDLKAFRNIVDLVDGVYMDIPAGGLFYSDPEQNLKISVPEGRQLLDGKMAEGVVRYRNSYVRGDLDRVDMQKRFMKEFFAQALTKDKVFGNMGDFIGIVLTYVKTDFGLTDIPQYLTSFSGLSADKISFYTMPGDARYIYGGWYYYQDMEEIQKLIESTFLNFDVESNKKDETEIANKSDGLKIQLFNGSDKSTILFSTIEKLTEDGFIVTDAGDYVGTKTNKTRIIAKDEDIGNNLKSYFKNASVDLDSEIAKGFDIVIILGKSE